MKFAPTLLLLIVIITALAACVKKAPAASPAQTRDAHSESVLITLLGTLKPAQDEYNDKKMKDAVVPAYVRAVDSYNKAKDRLQVYRQAVSLNTQTTYTRKQFEAALDTAVTDVAAMQRARGIIP